MNQGMPIWPMNPNMNNPGMGPGPSFPDFNNINQRLNSLENQVNRLERQVRRIENRVSRIESTMITPRSYDSQATGYGSNNDKYMM